MSSHGQVSGLPSLLPSLPPSPLPLCTPCVEGRPSATPHSSSLALATVPLQTLHLDVWGPAPVTGRGRSASSWWWLTTSKCSFLGFPIDALDFTFYHPPLYRFFDPVTSLLTSPCPSTPATPIGASRFSPIPSSSSPLPPCSHFSVTSTPPRSCLVRCVSRYPSSIGSSSSVVSFTTVPHTVFIVTAAAFGTTTVGCSGLRGCFTSAGGALFERASVRGTGSGGTGAAS
ncbi:unnamed protein product [Closterium sp. NIES-53]